jgi:hypothetical protein
VPARDPTCSVSGCGRPTNGVLTIHTAAADIRLSACEDHGQRASQGEWFSFDLLGSTYLLGPAADNLPATRYEPLRH